MASVRGSARAGSRAYWDRADPHRASRGAESFAGLLARTADFLDRLSVQESGPVVVFTHGLSCGPSRGRC